MGDLGEVLGDHRVLTLCGQISEVGGERATGIVDENIDGSETGGGLLDERRRRFGVAHVEHLGEDVDSCCLQRLDAVEERFSRRSQMATLAPSCPARDAVAAPMPSPAPVTSTTRPANRPGLKSLVMATVVASKRSVVYR